MPDQTTAPKRRFVDYCPPHRTTDAEYGEWVINVVSTFEGTSDGYLKADIDNRREWRTEAATWKAWLEDKRTCAFPGDQEHDHAMCEDAVADAEPAVPLTEVLEPYNARTEQRRVARRQSVHELLAAAVLEHENAWAAVLRGEDREHEPSADCWCDPIFAPDGPFGVSMSHRVEDEAKIRLCRAQLALSEAYRQAARLYRPESPCRTAMVNAASYLKFAADACEFAKGVRAVLADLKAQAPA